MMNSSTKPNLNGPACRLFTDRSPSQVGDRTFDLLVMSLRFAASEGQTDMRELNCVIMPNAKGWLLMVGSHRRGWFPTKGGALRAAIVEAQRGRAAGFYSSVRVQHETSTVRTDGRVGGAQAMPAAAADASDRSVYSTSNQRFAFGSVPPPKR
jgi:hypothetical protein